MAESRPVRAQSQPWHWLLLNLLVLPGLGSIRGGRRRSGYCQLVLGLIGFGLTCGALLSVGLRLVHSLENETPLEWDKRLVIWTVLGVILFFVSWFWGLATGIDLIRAGPDVPVGQGP